jgi:hypothetical protein
MTEKKKSMKPKTGKFSAEEPPGHVGLNSEGCGGGLAKKRKAMKMGEARRRKARPIQRGGLPPSERLEPHACSPELALRALLAGDEQIVRSQA